MRKDKKDIKKKKIIIIGGGISGLSAGIFGQKNGYETEIFEKNPSIGGLCTSWVRKDHLIDGCIHWLTGTKEGLEINKTWHNVNAFKQEDIIYSDNFGSIEYEGKVYTFWCDLDKFENEFIEVSPKDKKLIHRVRKYIEKFFSMPLPVEKPISTMNIKDFIKIGFTMIPYLPSYIYASHISQKKFAKKFKSPILKYVFSNIVPGDGNLYAALYAYGTVAFKNGGVPKGGSIKLSENMRDEYLRCGGKIHYNSEITSLIRRFNKIEGVKTKTGEIYSSDYFVSAIDAHQLTRKLLRKKHKDNHILKRFVYKKKYPLPSCVYISYLVDKDKLNSLNLTSTYEFQCSPFIAGKRTIDLIKIRDYSFDPTFIGKDNKVLLNVLIHQNDDDYYYWNKVHKDYRSYLQIKNLIAEDVRNRIEAHFPTLKNELEIIDVCSPCTYERYVNAYRGAYMPWAFTSNGNQLFHSNKIKGLKNLIFSGQWTIMPGGLPIALMSGRFAIQIISKKEHKPVILLNNYYK